jgi:hypothetical protein
MAKLGDLTHEWRRNKEYAILIAYEDVARVNLYISLKMQ